MGCIPGTIGQVPQVKARSLPNRVEPKPSMRRNQAVGLRFEYRPHEFTKMLLHTLPLADTALCRCRKQCLSSVQPPNHAYRCFILW